MSVPEHPSGEPYDTGPSPAWAPTPGAPGAPGPGGPAPTGWGAPDPNQPPPVWGPGPQQQFPQQQFPQQQAWNPGPAPAGPYGPGPGWMPPDPAAPYGRHPQTGEPLSDKQKLVAGLLQIFAGAFGAGRWYLGDTGIALAQLLTCGGLGIWSLIDGIMILTGNVRDKHGLPLPD